MASKKDRVMSRIEIPFDGRAETFFREEGSLDMRLIPNKQGENKRTYLIFDVGIDIDATSVLMSYVLSYQISNNLQV